MPKLLLVGVLYQPPEKTEFKIYLGTYVKKSNKISNVQEFT